MNFSSFYYIKEAFQEKDMVKALSLIKSYLERKLGVKLFQKYGVDYFKGASGTGEGIRYILSDGREIRFNFDGNEIESVNVWKADSRYPAVVIDTKGVSVVQILPFIVTMIKDPVPGIYEVELVDEEKEKELEAVAEAVQVKIGDKIYPTQKAAIEDLLKQGKDNKEIMRLTGAVAPSLNVVKKQLGMMKDIKVFEAGKEENNNPDISKLQQELNKIKYADPETVYSDLENLIKAVADKRIYFLLITGGPGTGKSYISSDVLNKNVGKDGWVLFKGAAAPMALYRILYENNGKVIVFDDFDKILIEKESSNILKAALDNKPKRQVSWLATGKTFNPKGLPEEEIDALVADNKLPNTFDFTGRVISITNKSVEYIKKLDDAIVSRAVHIDITLKRADIINRIKQLMPKIQPDIDMKYKEELLKFMSENADKMRGDIDIRKFDNAITLVQPLMAAGQTELWQRLVLNNI